MTPSATESRAMLEELATVLAASLSSGRRRRVVIDGGPGRAFQTDLRTVIVPVPTPGERSLRTLTCGLALQAAPTKEAVAATSWTSLRRRQRVALAWVEGEAAVRWAKGRWPGLRAYLERAFPWVDEGPVALDGAELERLARERARSARLGDPPALFGRLPPPLSAGGGQGSKRRTSIASRWSSRHRARREGSLPIPVSGPGTEPVLHPGEPGTMEALDGRAGHELGIPYDEWDHRAGRYRRGYVRVMELEAALPPGTAPAPLPLPHVTPARSVRRRFESGDVDIDAVVAWRCEVAAGDFAADARLFSQLVPVSDRCAWALLVDASASASLAGGRVLRLGVSHADRLARTLAADGEQVGVFAFRSRARERVEVHVLKRFDMPYRPLTRRLKPGGYTRLGAAIRHTGRRLVEVPAWGHVLVYLGDALPYDEGYGDAYGRADVAKAVDELRARGVQLVHASLAGGDEAALDEMFGPSGWRRTTTSAELLGLVQELQADIRRAT